MNRADHQRGVTGISPENVPRSCSYPRSTPRRLLRPNDLHLLLYELRDGIVGLECTAGLSYFTTLPAGPRAA